MNTIPSQSYNICCVGYTSVRSSALCWSAPIFLIDDPIKFVKREWIWSMFFLCPLHGNFFFNWISIKEKKII